MHAGNENVCFPPFISFFLHDSVSGCGFYESYFQPDGGEKNPVFQNVRATVES